MKKNIIIANWKCNPETQEEAKRLFEEIKNGIENSNTEVIICPPVIFLTAVSFKESGIKIGGQDCFWENKGAFTGQISPSMLKDAGCEYVIIGHSERRKIGETDEEINKKLKVALNAGLKPILCVGEGSEEREKNQAHDTVKKQLENALSNIESVIKNSDSFIIAYEPVWAIGSGNPCSFEEAEDMSIFIQKTARELLGVSPVRKIIVIYGGSVDESNAKDYITKSKMEGLLVGGASINSEKFIKIINSI
ncbi:MAG: triose-phosphate isomerase [Candidatus Parcubacteria bacterium]|nr:triose-phosphate isomerase [Candidatus Parcubacteria bacterium]